MAFSKRCGRMSGTVPLKKLRDGRLACMCKQQTVTTDIVIQASNNHTTTCMYEIQWNCFNACKKRYTRERLQAQLFDQHVRSDKSRRCLMIRPTCIILAMVNA